MTAETDIAAIDDGGANTAAEVRTALTSVLGSTPGWIEYLNARQTGETSHTDDLFFTGSSGGTDVTPTGSVTWTESNDRLFVEASSQSTNDIAARLWALTPTTSPVYIETALSLRAYNSNFPGAGIVFTDGTAATSNAIMFWIYKAANAGMWSGTLTNMATEEISGPSSPFQANWESKDSSNGVGLFVRLLWTASNAFKVGLAMNERQFSYSSGASFTLTPTHYGVFGSAWGSADPAEALFQYLRVGESDPS